MLNNGNTFANTGVDKIILPKVKLRPKTKLVQAIQVQSCFMKTHMQTGLIKNSIIKRQ
jgi:hypothetical protein